MLPFVFEIQLLSVSLIVAESVFTVIMEFCLMVEVPCIFKCRHELNSILHSRTYHSWYSASLIIFSIFSRYKGGPPLPRKLIVQEGLKHNQFNVEVYPLCLNLIDSRDNNSQSVVRLSKKVLAFFISGWPISRELENQIVSDGFYSLLKYSFHICAFLSGANSLRCFSHNPYDDHFMIELLLSRVFFNCVVDISFPTCSLW